jgi:hypothetical protein
VSSPKNSLEKWLIDNAAHIRIDNPMDIHLDDLFGITERREQIEIVPKLVCDAIGWLNESTKRSMLSVQVRVPLGGTPTLIAHVPNWEEISDDYHPTPPSICLLDVRTKLSRTMVESYRGPIVVPGLSTDDERLDIHFKSWRLLDDDDDDGWQREICIWYTAFAVP